MAAFVTILICSNLISAPKRVFFTISGREFIFGAGVLFFPISYLFGDILTEVYGYARSRKVVWAGFAAIVFASAMSWVVIRLPADPRWKNQAAFEAVFGNAPRIVLASIIGVLRRRVHQLVRPGQDQDPDRAADGSGSGRSARPWSARRPTR